MFDVVALLLVLAALFGWFNRRVVKLANSVGLLLLGLAASLALAGVDGAWPAQPVLRGLTDALRQINFTDVVINGLLAFLLFAGSMIVDLGELRGRAWGVAVLAVLGTVLSTVLVGVAFWLASVWIGHPISLAWALVFGALISPTDPVALLSVLKTIEIPLALQTEMEGEALFNDGVGVVLFTVLVTFALSGESADASDVWAVARLFGVEVVGGLVLGLAGGFVAYWAMRSVDDVTVEVLITLGLVAGVYALAQRVGASGPLAVVAAGLLIGDWAPRDAMSETTKTELLSFWRLADEILNAVLFLLIGLDVVVLRFVPAGLVLAGLAVPIVLAARFLSVSLPFLVFRWPGMLAAGNVPFLTWGGVRGGISVALALALPEDAAKPVVLAATYAVALFSIVVQGSTLGWVARKTLK
jgi:CPA1 family monovalent cation:H+ antiporter